MFKDFAIMNCDNRDLHSDLVNLGYRFVDPFNGIIYHGQGHIELLHMKATSRIC